MGMLEVIHRGCDKFKTSLYVDDATLFIKPTQQELSITIAILETFAEASGLSTNMSKTMAFPIQCSNIPLDFISSAGLVTAVFPCIYLGLPLHTRKLPSSIMQSLIQKIAKRLPG
jgi:hypothetical protein